MSVLSILIKPASEKCNLDCDYCFYHDISNKRTVKDYGFMSDLVAKKIIESAFEKKNIKKINFSFQGGEPTLIGVEFYQMFCKTVDKYKILFRDVEVEYFLQTNGTLITEQFLDFFLKYDFLIGLSIDSNKQAHDRYRRFLGGQVSFDRCIKTMDNFKEKQIRYNILTVVTKQVALDPKALYQFLKQYKIDYFQFIPCLDPINEELGKKEWSLLAGEYGDFLDQFFNYWYQDFKLGNRVTDIRIFLNFIAMLKNIEPESCDMKGICSNQNVIEADGKVYPCDFYVFEQLAVGDILIDSFDQIQSSDAVKKFIKNSYYLPKKCDGCQFLKLCRGGCTRNRYMTEVGIENYFCDSIYSFLDKNIEKLEEMSKYYK